MSLYMHQEQIERKKLSKSQRLVEDAKEIFILKPKEIIFFPWPQDHKTE